MQVNLQYGVARILFFVLGRLLYMMTCLHGRSGQVMAATCQYLNEGWRMRERSILQTAGSYFEFVTVKDTKNSVICCKFCVGSKMLSSAKNV